MRIRIKNALISHKVTIELEVSEEAWEQYQDGEDIEGLLFREDSVFLSEDEDTDVYDYDFLTSDLEVDEIDN